MAEGALTSALEYAPIDHQSWMLRWATQVREEGRSHSLAVGLGSLEGLSTLTRAVTSCRQPISQLGVGLLARAYPLLPSKLRGLIELCSRRANRSAIIGRAQSKREWLLLWGSAWPQVHGVTVVLSHLLAHTIVSRGLLLLNKV